MIKTVVSCHPLNVFSEIPRMHTQEVGYRSSASVTWHTILQRSDAANDVAPASVMICRDVKRNK